MRFEKTDIVKGFSSIMRTWKMFWMSRFRMSSTQLSLVPMKLVSMLWNFFSMLLTMRPNKLECLCLANTFLSSQTFAGSTRSLPKKEAYEKSSNWVCSGLSSLRPDWKGFPMANALAYWASSVMKEKSFMTLTPGPNVIKLSPLCQGKIS